MQPSTLRQGAPYLSASFHEAQSATRTSQQLLRCISMDSVRLLSIRNTAPACKKATKVFDWHNDSNNFVLLVNLSDIPKAFHGRNLGTFSHKRIRWRRPRFVAFCGLVLETTRLACLRCRIFSRCNVCSALSLQFLLGNRCCHDFPYLGNVLRMGVMSLARTVRSVVNSGSYSCLSAARHSVHSWFRLGNMKYQYITLW